ncbi:hypothetical protein WJ87_06935 [Burkholderia ubonensis]|nr:hypothetical protein WJ87_06935 [Burkholderia ubonensis]
MSLVGCSHDGLLGRINGGSHRLHRLFCYLCRRRANESLALRVLQIFFVFDQLALVLVGSELHDACNHVVREVRLGLLEPSIRKTCLHQSGIHVAKPAIVKFETTFRHIGDTGRHHLERVGESFSTADERLGKTAKV